MKGLTLTMKEQTRLHILNTVIERRCSVVEAAQLMGVSERHLWRLLAAYRKEGAAALAHGNRNRLPSNATSAALKASVIALASERYQGVNHTHFTELLSEREGIVLSRSTVRRLLTSAGLSSSKHRQSPRHRYRRERMPQEGMLVQIDGSHHRRCLLSNHHSQSRPNRWVRNRKQPPQRFDPASHIRPGRAGRQGDAAAASAQQQ